jgi:polar amino acid transport system substrate-binding protein
MGGKWTMRRVRTGLLLLLACSQTALPQDGPFKVDVAIFPPNVLESQQRPGGFEGFDIDLWDEIARIMETDFVYRKVPFEQLLKEVEAGEADVGLAGITIRSQREETLDFSYPYMESGLRILARRGGHRLGALWEAIVSSGAFRWLGYLVLFLALCARLLYFAEKGRQAISDHYFPGIFEAAWCIFATMTTVGYGDIVPQKWIGRFVSVLVMITGIALFGIVVAELSVGLTFNRLQSQLNGPEDLKGRRVSTVAGSTSIPVIERYGARVEPSETIDLAYERLARGEVDAVVFDGPALRFYMKNRPSDQITFAGGLFDTQNYGIAFPDGSPLREQVNRALLQIQENGRYQQIYEKWFGTE